MLTRKHFALPVILIAVAALATGCLDFTQTFQINADKSGTVRLRMVFHKHKHNWNNNRAQTKTILHRQWQQAARRDQVVGLDFVKLIQTTPSYEVAELRKKLRKYVPVSSKNTVHLMKLNKRTIPSSPTEPVKEEVVLVLKFDNANYLRQIGRELFDVRLEEDEDDGLGFRLNIRDVLDAYSEDKRKALPELTDHSLLQRHHYRVIVKMPGSIKASNAGWVDEEKVQFEFPLSDICGGSIKESLLEVDTEEE